jgi:hypothetical protein
LGSGFAFLGLNGQMISMVTLVTPTRGSVKAVGLTVLVDSSHSARVGNPRRVGLYLGTGCRNSDSRTEPAGGAC